MYSPASRLLCFTRAAMSGSGCALRLQQPSRPLTLMSQPCSCSLCMPQLSQTSAATAEAALHDNMMQPTFSTRASKVTPAQLESIHECSQSHVQPNKRVLLQHESGAHSRQVKHQQLHHCTASHRCSQAKRLIARRVPCSWRATDAASQAAPQHSQPQVQSNKQCPYQSHRGLTIQAATK